MPEPKKKFATVDAYIASFSPDVQALLQSIRSAVKEAVPESEEGISYQQPVVNYHGVLLWYAAFKRHISLFVPHTRTLFEDLQAELAPYEIDKSTIKFRLDKPIPPALIEHIATFRAQENRETPARPRRR